MVALILRTRQLLADIALSFSVPLLMRTLFSPWRRIVSLGSSNILESLRAMVDNSVSRFVGFGVRVLTLIAAAVVLALTLVSGIIAVIVWPLLPPLAVALVAAGLLP